MTHERTTFAALLRDLQAGRIDRRRFMVAAGALGVSAAALRGLGIVPAAAQESSPAAGGETIRSQTREEFAKDLVEAEGFTEAATPGGTLIDSNAADIQTVMPFLVEEVASATIATLIFDTLPGPRDPRTGVPTPNGLADYWEIAPDRKTYTFYLNKNATWHDGQPVTAADVQFSFDALADPKTGSTYTASFNDTVASWKALDDHTFQMVAKQPQYDFLYNLVAYIVPKHVWEGVPRDKWKSDPGATGQDPARVVGSGPFKFQEWKTGESVTLVRNGQYHDKVPNIDTYVMRIWPDQTALVNALLNGDIDAAELTAPDVATVQGSSGIKVDIIPTRNFTYLEYNLDPKVTTLFQDKRVRQALFYAIDRESIVKNIYLGYAEVAQGTQPVISYAYDPNAITTKYTYDPEKAKQLLTEAGWTDANGDGVVEKDGQALKFEYLYPAGQTTLDQLAAYLQDAWKAIGVAITPRALEFPALIEATTTTPTFAIAQYSFLWDATFIQDAMFGCNQYQVGFNDMKYCNPDLDKINAEAKVTFDEAKRRDLLIQASNIVNEDVPVMVLHFGKGLYAYSEKLQNYKPSTWGIPYNYVWIQQ